MPESIKLAWAWLGAQNAALPYLLTTLSCLLGVDLWKHTHPKSWHWVASLTPWAEEVTKAQELAHNFLLALPTTLGAALFTWLASGGAFWPTVLGAVAGAGAPLSHHIRKALAAFFKKPPPGGDGGDQKPVGAREHIVLPNNDGSLPPPAAALSAQAFLTQMLRRRGLRMYAAAFVAALTLGSLVSLIGCSSAAPSPTCSDAVYRNQLLDCGVRSASCVQEGGTDEVCGAVCDKEWADWQERCGQ
ncbi:MAG TPA: hypothetical protein VJN18_32715 [Polyangiaceae bacterium]|nr:hypothetical protein [Polyangiaceae bacterium]